MNDASTTKIYFANRVCFQVEVMVDNTYEETYKIFSNLFKWEKSDGKCQNFMRLPNKYLFEKDGILFEIERRQSDLTIIWIFAKK